jgi:transposase InsO family protein
MKASLVTQAMKAALRDLNLPAGLISHSDKGSQYLSKAMCKLAQSW